MAPKFVVPGTVLDVLACSGDLVSGLKMSGCGPCYMGYVKMDLLRQLSIQVGVRATPREAKRRPTD